MYLENDFIEIRRRLHQIPEIGLEEFQTHALLLSIIESFPQDFIEIKTQDTAILVVVKGFAAKKRIGWRTDIDGLPITEMTGLPFASRNAGRMHACGHDFHMTIALGILQDFCQRQPKNDFVFLFQPAEENYSGGKILYENGFLAEDFPDEFYALHVKPELAVGTISTCVGTIFAGVCGVKAHFIGTGGHAAYPHLANDMVVAASAFVGQTQTIVSRNVDPTEGAVLTIGTFQAGTADNVIAKEAHLAGTLRALSFEKNELTKRRLVEIAAGIERSFDCQLNLELDQMGYLPVVNDAAITTHFMDFCRRLPNVYLVEAKPEMAGEDFGFLLSKSRGLLFLLGIASPHGLHHGEMAGDEKAIQIGIDTVTSYFREIDQF